MPKGVYFDRKIVICKTCNTQFSCIGSRKRASYCSRKCFFESKKAKPRTPVPCVCCGIQFVPKRKNSTHCSKQCISVTKGALNRQRGFFNNYKQAKKVLMADSMCCSKCGWNKEIGILELHHIDRNTKNNHISNLQILCPNCHSLDHFYAKDGQFKNNLGVKS